MPTRREQLQGYRFVTRRIVSAMLSGEPESSLLPMRRLGLGVFASFMIATIILAGFGVYGLLVPGGRSSWRKDGTFLVERETGDRYVYTRGMLHPVLNDASARLYAGATPPEQVSKASLRGVPRGQSLGIAGAPDSLPDAADLLGPPWTVCSSPRSVGGTALATELMIGHALPGGADLAGRGLIVTEGTAAGATYLLWHDHRYRIPDKTALTSLDLTGAARAPIGTAMLGAVPRGPDLAAPPIPGRGDRGLTIDGTSYRVGTVFRSGTVFYLLLGDGLSTIHEVTAKLVLAGAAPVQVSSGAIADHLRDRTFEPDGMPTSVPTILSLTGDQPAVCAAYRGGSGDEVTLRTYQQAPGGMNPNDESAVQEVAGPGDTGPIADRVVVPGGRGALVRERPGPGVTAGTTVFLVTDQGRKYPLIKTDNDDATTKLGYAGATPVPVPPSLLSLVPTGPALDPDAVRHFVDPSPSPSTSPDK